MEKVLKDELVALLLEEGDGFRVNTLLIMILGLGVVILHYEDDCDKESWIPFPTKLGTTSVV